MSFRTLKTQESTILQASFPTLDFKTDAKRAMIVCFFMIVSVHIWKTDLYLNCIHGFRV